MPVVTMMMTLPPPLTPHASPLPRWQWPAPASQSPPVTAPWARRINQRVDPIVHSRKARPHRSKSSRGEKSVIAKDMKKMNYLFLLSMPSYIRDLFPLGLCPSQTEGTYDKSSSGYLKSYSMFVTNLNAAQILLHPKWPQILVTTSLNCLESEPNLYMSSVNCVILQCKHPKVISILIAETFLLPQSIFLSCYFQKLWSVYDKDPFYPQSN